MSFEHYPVNYSNSKTMIIPATDRNCKQQTKQMNLLINSKDRNTSKYSDAGKYTVELPYEYNDIIQVDANFHIPQSEGYNIIKDYNDTLHIYYENANANYPSSLQTLVDNVLVTSVIKSTKNYPECPDASSNEAYNTDSSSTNQPIPICTSNANIKVITVPEGYYKHIEYYNEFGDETEYTTDTNNKQQIPKNDSVTVTHNAVYNKKRATTLATHEEAKVRYPFAAALQEALNGTNGIDTGTVTVTVTYNTISKSYSFKTNTQPTKIIGIICYDKVKPYGNHSRENNEFIGELERYYPDK